MPIYVDPRDALVNAEILFYGGKLGDNYRSVIYGLAHCVVLRSKFRLRCKAVYSPNTILSIPNWEDECEECLVLFAGNYSWVSPLLFVKLFADGSVKVLYSKPNDNFGAARELVLWWCGDVCDPKFDLDGLIRRFDGMLFRWRFGPSLDTWTIGFMSVLYVLFSVFCFVNSMDWQCGMFLGMGLVLSAVTIRLLGVRRLWYK